MKQTFTIMRYANRLVQHTRATGLRSSAALVGKNLIWPYCKWLTERRIRAHEQFDIQLGLDTQSPIPIRHLETWAPGAQSASHYEGAAIPLVHRILRRLTIDFPRFTFIDLGSGKGRVLLIAAQYPFKSVIGVEFSETLHSIAQSNIAKFIEHRQIKTRPISINLDADAFDFSHFGDKVVFSNNPFGGNLMLQVLDNLQSSLANAQDEGIIIYLSPIPIEVKERLDTFQFIAQSRFLSHYGGFQKYYIYRLPNQLQR